MSVEIFQPIEPSKFQPKAIIEFPRVGLAPALELHVWEFRCRTQVEWVIADGVGIGMVMGVEC